MTHSLSTGETGPRIESDAGPTATLVIVTYNSSKLLPQLLTSIPDGVRPYKVEVLVVDNDSRDGTDLVAAKFPWVTFIRTGSNLGYSGAINVARGHMGPGRALVILNPDLVLAPGSVARLLDALAGDPSIGIASPLNREPNGDVARHLRRDPGVVRALGDSLFGAHWEHRPRFLSEMLLRDDDYETAQDVDWAGGAALAISERCNGEVGPWDSERYFLFAEESDYARRARDLGFRVRFVPDAEVMHVGGASAGSGPRRGQLRALLSVNRIRFFEARHGRLSSRAYQGVVGVQHLLRARDPEHREALRFVSSRRSWQRLPPNDTPVPGSAK